MELPFPIRQECPPGACICQREQLLQAPYADQRILRLTREEEKKLVARLEKLRSLDDLWHMQTLLYEQLGIKLIVQPGQNEVRTVRGLHIELEAQVGLCRKTTQHIPAAIRKGLEANLQIVYELLDQYPLVNGQTSLFATGDEARKD
ncbi:hypothetical protein [Alcaligenes endophyticus]|uniref:Ribosomal protein S3AE n=1 Tax=Alcaligenes endophyticus TaxID=1929088 RepID=A0ABT8EM68_9BURK|nr:hypothetical protein [Alcaligenes endophyticus]MCX5591125.1 hypothetical protein [Alcaligenes endophyticus]MDN4122297.1 hypothetical protein [Alcaligenes endophyticus]